MQDAFRDMMMDTINDIQKRNGCFYISSMVKEYILQMMIITF